MKTYQIELNEQCLDFEDTALSLLEKFYPGKNKYKIVRNDRTCYIRIHSGIINVSNLAFILSHFIVEKFEELLVRKIIKEKYPNLASCERKSIFHIYLENIANESDLMGKLLKQQRKLHLANGICDFLTDSRTININGYIQFRLQDYGLELEEYLESIAEIYFTDKEYNEFIDLLKALIQTRSYRTGEIHIMFQPAHSFTLYENGMKPYISTQTGKSVRDQSNEILIGLLSEILPEKITLHRSDLYCQNGLTDTLISLFEKRLIICGGCSACLN